MSPVLEPVVRPECPQERLLPGVLGPLAEQPAEIREHVVALREVEPLERRDPLPFLHCHHHRLKRARVPTCETAPSSDTSSGSSSSRVPALPAAGQIVQGERRLEEPAGGGGVIARQVARLAGRCEFFTALGDDELGRRAERRLAELGVDVHVAALRRDETGAGCTSTRTASGRSRCSPRSCGRAARFRCEGYDARLLRLGGRRGAAVRSARAVRRCDRARAADAPRGGGPARPARRQRARRRRTLRRLSRREDRRPDRRPARRNGERRAVRQPRRCPAPIVDTYGAGDSFSAALCFALARGDTWPTRSRWPRAPEQRS